MRRYVASALVALLVVTAGCTGVITDDPAAPEPTPSEDGSAGEPIVEPATAGSGSTGAISGQPSPAEATESATRLEQSSIPTAGTHGSLSAPGDAGTVTVAGTGQASADPERALVSVTVQARAETADEAREQVADDVARMRDAIRELGVPDGDVRTTYYSLSPEYEYSRDRQELVGYVASHGFEIEADVAEAGPVVDTAVGNGADQVTGVQFTLTDERREELRRAALTEAVGDARADADAIAAAADLTITGVHSASTSGPVVTPYYGRVATEAADGGTTFDAGPVTVSASVTIAYSVD